MEPVCLFGNMFCISIGFIVAAIAGLLLIIIIFFVIPSIGKNRSRLNSMNEKQAKTARKRVEELAEEDKKKNPKKYS